MLKKGSIITLNNNENYFVGAIVKDNNNDYAIISNIKNEKDVKICEVKNAKSNIEVIEVKDEKLIEKLCLKLYKELSMDFMNLESDK